jgi:hypothetical protein
MALKDTTQIILRAKDETAKAFTSAEGNVKSLGGGMDNIAAKSKLVVAAVAAIGVAAAAAFAAMAKEALDTAAEIQKLSQIAGVSAEAFQELTAVADRYQVSQDALSDGLKELNLRADEFVKTGGGSAAEAFKTLNFSVNDLNNRLSDAPALFAEIARRMEGLSQASKIRIADEIFGGQGGEQFVQIFNAGSKAIGDQTKRWRELGGVLSNEMVAGAAKSKAELDEMRKLIETKLTRAILENRDAIMQAIGAFIEYGTAAGRALGILAPSKQERIAELNELIREQEELLTKAEEKWLTAMGKGAVHPSLVSRVRFLTNNLRQLEAQLEALEGRKPLEITIKKKPPPALVSPEEEKKLLEEADATYKFFLQQRSLADAARIEEIRARFAERDELDRERAILTQELAVQDMDEMFNAREEHEERMAEMIKRFQDRNREDEMANQASILALWESGWKGKAAVVGEVMGDVSVLMESNSRKMFEVGKAAAIAQTVISTILGAQHAYTSMAQIPYVGPILGAIAAAAAIAAGAIRVQKIKSTSFRGGGSVGSAGGRSSIGGGGRATPPVQNVPAQPTQQALPPPRIVNVTVESDSILTDAWVRDNLIPTLNEAAGDGVTINAAAA